MNVLDGIKVVDVTAWAFVPAAGGVLAHWGADVVKVESPMAPDP
ncbi:MAG: CoA transferase, partial [Acidimicrobiia bacterium]